jgi:uncharacterized protein
LDPIPACVTPSLSSFSIPVGWVARWVACIDCTSEHSPITLPSSYNVSVMIPPDLLEILVCPACKKPLVLKTNPEALKCNACNRVYPVRDNIPVLLIDQASTDPS